MPPLSIRSQSLILALLLNTTMQTSSPFLALCLLLALGSAAPQPYGVDNYLSPRQSGCVSEISPEGEACKSLPLQFLPITSSTHILPQTQIHSHHPISNPRTPLQKHIPTPKLLQTATAAAMITPSPPPGTAITVKFYLLSWVEDRR